ncbi:LAQU0S02e08988g1_1 [Lachancea quebecensis]|uniref:LAQU0S02e08988g1_1 n=1 Tax=Lachancea quebecensis TaxID=1654605 RepID=A0A0P1KNU3_9SACH|nr:LAQU0S02e08988g1_1 [Lachancea quebecensis]
MNEKLSASDFYRLSHEYSEHAHKLIGNVNTEEQVQQYQTLIYHAIHALICAKEQFQLSAEQDVVVTLELCNLLIQETVELDLAETYLSSVKERLHATDLLHEKMLVEEALVRVARMRGSSQHIKDSLRNVNAALSDLDGLSRSWYLYFSFLRIELISMVSPSDQRILRLFEELIQKSEGIPPFHLFIICSYLCYCLDQHLSVPMHYLQELATLSESEVPPPLKLWKHLIELLVLMQTDSNITGKLSEFKEFVTVHKKGLTNPSFRLRLDDRVEITLESLVFRYKDFKNVILLFQSVSYLTNCYDKKANFSTKFLPKVQKAAKELLDSTGATSALGINNMRFFYEQMLDLCHYYTCLEGLILEGACAEVTGETEYTALINAMRLQVAKNSEGALKAYSKMIDSKVSVEFRLIGLLNSFVIKVATMSKNGGTVAFDDYQNVNEIWASITALADAHEFRMNQTWQCTLVVIWIATHFHPFTNAQLSRENDADYLEKLKWFHSANSYCKLASGSTHEHFKDEVKPKAPTLKKALLLLFLLNYVAGATVVHDLGEKCQISNACFYLGQQQQMPLMRYLAGLSHLLNCGLAMKSKDVAITRSKLKELVDFLLKSGFELAQ